LLQFTKHGQKDSYPFGSNINTTPLLYGSVCGSFSSFNEKPFIKKGTEQPGIKKRLFPFNCIR
tara:strand:- start:3218 stop:3406 length:189 start_codon:yes stop_codon:yes gene_type:complete